MEIKVIDLLNIIADDKELPEKFMYKGHLYYKQKYNEMLEVLKVESDE